MFKKKCIAMALSGMMALSALAGCGSTSSTTDTAAGGADAAAVTDSAAAQDVNIGYVNLADTDVFCMSRRDAFKEAAEAAGYSVEATDGNNDVQKQIDQTKSFIAKGVDAIIIVPCDAAGIVPAVQEANKAGIPVILFGNNATGADDLKYTFIGSPHYDSGYMQGEYFASILPENSNICYLAGTAGLDHAVMRRNGMKDALEKAGRTDVTILDDQDGDYVKDEGMRITQAWIQTFGEGDGKVKFNAIIAANDQMALGAMEALKGANLLTNAGEIKISGIDGTADAMQAVKDGFMAQTVLQDAPGQGAAAVETIQKILAGEDPGAEVMVPYVSITKDNVDQYLS